MVNYELYFMSYANLQRLCITTRLSVHFFVGLTQNTSFWATYAYTQQGADTRRVPCCKHRGVALQMWNVPITSKEIRTVYIIDIINNKYIDNIYK